MNILQNRMHSERQSVMFTCPVGGKRSSFQVVDESGSGEHYAGLAYVCVDSEGIKYQGVLNSEGVGIVEDHFAGPVALIISTLYQGLGVSYRDLMARQNYPLKITELQVRAEQTRFINQDASRPQSNPYKTDGDTDFCQIEVRHLVEHVSHLPPEVESHYPPCIGAKRLMGKHGQRGVCISGSRHTVLQIRPLRALRPLLSTTPQFCALNLYQLALMATLSYCPFGQRPDTTPILEPSVSFTQVPSVGNWFAEALATYKEIWRVDAGQIEAHYPLYEEVAYSRRFEIVPFDSQLYPSNDHRLGADQESPAKVHFLDDRGHANNTDTQAFVTHSDEIILIAVRGTSEIGPDGLRDIDAFQVPFDEGVGAVHRGFYEAAKVAAKFVTEYLERFYSGQTLLICGHSLGGAIALILAETLRRRPEGYNIVLYTYGAPRAGDEVFIAGAKPLVHHRMVNHNDPVPSVPMTWMKIKPSDYEPRSGLLFGGVPRFIGAYVTSIINWDGEPFGHHGELQHFMPVDLGKGERSHILWAPACETLAQHAACSLALEVYEGLPRRAGMVEQMLSAADHSMTHGYVPCSWATLKRWQEALDLNRARITDLELEWVETLLERVKGQVIQRSRELRSSADPYRRTTQYAISSLQLEAKKIEETLMRLLHLKHQALEADEVYGHHAAQPEALAVNIERWLAHAENKRKEQLAMAPPGLSMRELTASITGFREHVIGAPFDIDDLLKGA